MKLFIVRHGETEENKKKIVQGHFHGTLSEEGLNQISKLASRLKDENFDFIFSSDLDRARITAEGIGKFHLNVPLILKEDLRERDWGDFEGKNLRESEDWIKIENFPDKQKEYGVETIEEGIVRAHSVFDFLVNNYPDKNILLVSHGSFISMMISLILGKSIKEIDKIRNTSLTILDVDEFGNPEIRLFNSTEHLD